MIFCQGALTRGVARLRVVLEHAWLQPEECNADIAELSAAGASDDDEGDLLDVLLSERPIFTAFFETPREVRRSGGE